jgi:hypothetical protein
MEYIKTTARIVPPLAAIAVNKSRIKLYNKNTDSPTYYLQKGQEFEIELFNPTHENILAKIHLNNKPLSQGGLVLRPGERVFVERYLDVPKKFLFDTYEVGDSAEVQKAIEKNGDFKVEFFKEKTKNYINLINCTGTATIRTLGNLTNTTYTTNTCNGITRSTFTSNSTCGGSNSGSIGLGTTTSGYVAPQTTNFCNTSAGATLDFMAPEMDRTIEPAKTRSFAKKTVETGRVEKGSNSDQKIQQIEMDFEYYPFHTIVAKLLPISQKISTSKDLNVRQYCTSCGHKATKGDRFCSSCGTKM